VNDHKHRALVVLVITLGVVAFRQTPLCARGLPINWGQISRKSLEKAEIISVGKITSSRLRPDVALSWPAYFKLSNVRLTTREAEFQVDNVIKGPKNLTQTPLHILFPVADSERAFVADFETWVRKSRAVVCLKRCADAADAYILIPQGGFMVLGPKPDVNGWNQLTTRERLDRELISTFTSPAFTKRERRTAFLAITITRKLGPASKTMIAALRDCTRHEDVRFAGRATSVLISLGDITTIYALPGRLENAGSECGITLAWIERKPEFVPVLAATFMKAGPQLVHIRRGAIEALRNTPSEKAVAALAAALNDKDEMVRYHAVMGLYYQTGRKKQGWAPSLDLYRQSPNKYVAFWKRYWKEEGEGNYPSLEDVLREFKQKRDELNIQAPNVKKEELTIHATNLEDVKKRN